MNLSCPTCGTVYDIPNDLPWDTLFHCASCGFNAPLEKIFLPDDEPEPEPEPEPEYDDYEDDYEDDYDDDQEPRAAGQGLPPWAPGVAIMAVVAIVGVIWVSRDTSTGDRRVRVSQQADPGQTSTPDPGENQEEARLARARREAEELEAKNDLAGALAVYEALPSTIRQRSQRTIDRLRVDRYAQQVDRTFSEVKRLVEAGDRDGALTRLRALYAEQDALRDSPPGRKVARKIEEVEAQAQPTARPDPTPEPTRSGGPGGEPVGEEGDELDEEERFLASIPAREEPADRTQAFQEHAAKVAGRIDELRTQIAVERAGLESLRTAEVERARTASHAAPIDITLAGGYLLEGAVVETFDEQSFSLRAGGDVVSYPWDAIPSRTAYDIRELAVREDEGLDHLRLGFWSLRQRMFPEARRAFRKAVERDSELSDRVPDVESIRQASRVFSGRMERSGTNVEVSYDFRREAEADDWESVGGRGARLGVADGDLFIQGSGMFLAMLKEVGFDGRVDIGASIGGVSNENVGVVFGLAFGFGTRQESIYLVAVWSSGDLGLFHAVGGGNYELIDHERNALRGDHPRVRLQVREDRLTVHSRGQTQIARKVRPVWDDVRVFVGGTCQGQGQASLQSITMKGRVRYSWLRKSFGELEALLYGALAKADELPIFSTQGSPPAAETLSAEDAFGMADVSSEARKKYEEACHELEGDPELQNLINAGNILGSAVEESPAFPAAHYVRAAILQKLGQSERALRELDAALRTCPNFYEAMCLQARALADLSRWEEALAAAESAIACRPDFPNAYAARGGVQFLSGDLEGALGDFELASALEPGDEELRGLRRNVAHVLSGPPWSRRYTAETEHYLVESNTTARNCEEYARELEAVRSYYADEFGIPEREGVPKARVLIFDTEEGFHGYANLTASDRLEFAVGVYMPRYRQLLLFEPKDDETREETRQTLYHEGFHQFLHFMVPDNRVPIWLNEGMAEYFGASSVSGDRVSEKGKIIPGRLRDLKMFLQHNSPVPFDRLMQMSQPEFYSVGWATYAQAWSMIHYFKHAAPRALQDRFDSYVQLVREGTRADEAFQQAWGGTQWSRVHNEWKTYVAGLQEE